MRTGDSLDRTEDKLEVNPDTKVEVPAELQGLLFELQKHSTDLQNARIVIGRLQQIISRIVVLCNNTEDDFKRKRQELITKLNLKPNKWVIDFDEKCVFVATPGMPRPA